MPKTLPKTNTLRALLADATPGPWEPMGPQEAGWDVEAADREYLATFLECEGKRDAPNSYLAALAPDLAAEVIRLREELTRSRDGFTKDSQSRFFPEPYRMFAAETAHELTEILEGGSNA